MWAEESRKWVYQLGHYITCVQCTCTWPAGLWASYHYCILPSHDTCTCEFCICTCALITNFHCSSQQCSDSQIFILWQSILQLPYLMLSFILSLSLSLSLSLCSCLMPLEVRWRPYLSTRVSLASAHGSVGSSLTRGRSSRGPRRTAGDSSTHCHQGVALASNVQCSCYAILGGGGGTVPPCHFNIPRH